MNGHYDKEYYLRKMSIQIVKLARRRARVQRNVLFEQGRKENSSDMEEMH